MNKKILLAILPITALLLTGCSSGTAEPTATKTVYTQPELTTDEQFLIQVRSTYNQYAVASSDSDLIALAHQTCDIFDMGYTVDDIVNQLISSGNFTTQDEFEFAGLVVGAGVKYYCPEYISVLQDYMSS